MISDNDIDTALKTLDAADSVVDPHASTAAARLRAITAEDPVTVAVTTARRDPVSQPRRLHISRRIAWGGAIVAAATGAAIVIPAILGGGGSAIAGWDPTPHAIPAEQLAQVVDDCKETIAGMVSGRDPHDEATATSAEGPDTPPSLAPADPNSPTAQRIYTATAPVTEQRGPWTTVLLTDDSGLWARCVTGPHGGGAAAGTDQRYDPPTPQSAGLVSSGYGYVLGASYSLITGVTGSDVAGLSFNSTVNGTVAATVSNGHFVLWMPGSEWETFPDSLPVTLTLADGTHRAVDLGFE